jgi:hypothetical protein
VRELFTRFETGHFCNKSSVAGFMSTAGADRDSFFDGSRQVPKSVLSIHSRAVDGSHSKEWRGAQISRGPARFPSQTRI